MVKKNHKRMYTHINGLKSQARIFTGLKGEPEYWRHRCLAHMDLSWNLMAALRQLRPVWLIWWMDQAQNLCWTDLLGSAHLGYAMKGYLGYRFMRQICWKWMLVNGLGHIQLFFFLLYTTILPKQVDKWDFIGYQRWGQVFEDLIFKMFFKVWVPFRFD